MPPLLLHVFSTFEVGGPQIRFAALANHLGRSYRHGIIAMDGNYECLGRLDHGLNIICPVIEIRKGDTFGAVWCFRGVLRGLKPDVLITYNWGTIEWAIANRLRIVRHIHMEDGFGQEERARQIPRRVLLRRLFLGQSTVVVPSQTLLDIATRIWRLPPGRLHYIPNGVDLGRFAATPACAALPRWPGEGPVVGSVGGLRAVKNLARLLRAFRLTRDAMPARLVIVGDGPERPELEALARALDLTSSVHFTGHVADPSPLYRSFDLFAISSDTEQMPFSVLEAMAAGLAVAATDVGDIRAMLAVENRQYLAAFDEQSLAGSLGTLLGNVQLRRRVGAANRRKAEQEYDQEAMFRNYAALLDGGSTRFGEASVRRRRFW
jgi:glycosyltransferase involved in cell wall biosynthesis